MSKIKRFTLINILIFLGYLLLSWIPSLFFPGISPFWPPDAFAVFSVLIWREYPLPGIFSGLYFASLLFFNGGINFSFFVAFIDTFSLLISLLIVKRLRFDFRDVFKDVKNFLIFAIFLGIIKPLISSLCVSFIFLTYGRIVYSDLLNFIENWFISEFATIISITPFLYLLWIKRRNLVNVFKSKKDIVEFFVLIILTITLWYLCFILPNLDDGMRIGLLFVVILPTVWSVFSLDFLITYFLISLVFLLMFYATIFGFGPYYLLMKGNPIFDVEVFSSAMSFAVLLFSVLKNQIEKGQAFNSAMIEHTLAGIVVLKNRVILSVNKRFLNMLGYKNINDLIGKSSKILYFDNEHFERTGKLYEDLATKKTAQLRDVKLLKADGGYIICDISGGVINEEENLMDSVTVWTFFDVTERYQMQRAKEHEYVNKLKKLSIINTLRANVNKIILSTESEKDLFQSVCDLTLYYTKMLFSYIACPNPNGEIIFYAKSGNTDFLNQIDFSVNLDENRGKNLMSYVWNTKKPVYIQSYEEFDVSKNIKEKLLALGVRSGAGLPIYFHEKLYAIFILASDEPNYFDSELKEALEDLVRDISNGLERIELLQTERNLMIIQEALLENTLAGVVMTKEENIINVNSRALSIFGYHSAVDLMGKSMNILFSSEVEYEKIKKFYSDTKDNKKVFINNIKMITQNKKEIYCDIGFCLVKIKDEELAIWTLIDVTDRFNLEIKLHDQARIDPLTNLLNRRALMEDLQYFVARAKRNKSVFAVCMIDLDDFKVVNDTFGHSMGDKLLKEFANRLRLNLRSSDLVARIGGDEFIVLIDGLNNEEYLNQLKSAFNRIHLAVEEDYELIPGKSVRIEMSLGASIYPIDSTKPEELIRKADIAMYQIKQQKNNRVNWWQIGVK
ncbi:PAS domain S-box-containing protein/diguanylate cyclase (GGDEF) domain-containing protein [Thermodesulfobium acidiphilum]|uniref:PAS domain S-box-containing protein/diguanylate cyclase (GGDEF) domain-containing protein n=1 Tax=Thermodesulfobium acidiphilum TaxID=1794699 RepID=A0A2R4W236_THEAF|nr:diguanylate cyclase [Thermodesulfobium acidiphilum]AWB10758.1 PAS domain S-box-containing protein/diguanylate cyclase (GGDEF) domain-containing protein [Thermodesulfobium acidiphilum]